ncbi:SAM-dependent methyltransferase [Pseudoroseicyclus tamaricis]|uniref:Class I SAM-dependent methyltransferase n=1 Tax=Pseudoroseicyclus tamaricis TaxID=2705421 RepID=A0A6B2JFQ7_9RHOB|nr:cyclopropane-fatty-acyl-phospholipid synthase family protein [Pseudoroseicyclus tamaricis]NDU99910.1 class I SAM-dependent methyltransferase [Pseudoroseicyclus tamaricis]
MWDKIFDAAMRRFVQRGALEVTVADGPARRYGEPGAEPVHVHLADEALLRKVILTPDMGIGEGYTDGRVIFPQDDPRPLIRLALMNRAVEATPFLMRLLDSIAAPIQRFIAGNPLIRSRQNVAHHYDLDGRLYDLFLDEDRQYSCAYFPDDELSLEEAQVAKKRHIIGKLCLEPGMRVLDIGCGWGGMALTLAKDYGAQVVGVTLSEEQLKIGRQRVKDAGLEDKIDLRLMDYRDVTEQFDRIVSVGMFEHVGRRHYREYFDKVRDLLTEEGVALIHTIGSTDAPRATSTWTRKYIFPGGYIPSMSETMAQIEKAHLVTADVEVWRTHYAKTLRHWHERFMSHVDEAEKLHDDRFVRMWRFYLASAEEGFRLGTLVNFQFQLARSNTAVPVTRDYLYRN